MHNPFLQKLFELFQIAGVPYCVLHGYEMLPEVVVSDVDICVDHKWKNSIDRIIDLAARKSGYSVIQKIHYDDPHCYYYVCGNSQGVHKVDILIDRFGINSYHFKSDELLKGRTKFKKFYIPSSEMQIAYLATKRAIKGDLNVEHLNKMNVLCDVDFTAVPRGLSTICNDEFLTDFAFALTEGNIDHLEALLVDLRSIVKRRSFTKKTVKGFYALKRFVNRFLHSTGMVIVLLAPDGAGKSSVADALKARLKGSFRDVCCFHWRPGVFPKLRRREDDTGKKLKCVIPIPQKYKYGRTISFLRWLYYLCDFTIGYYVKIFPLKIRTVAVVFDRYYYDVIVDPLRYGFNIPMWLIKFALTLIPKPDLVFYLDNMSENLFKRKNELSAEEVSRQVAEWRDIIALFPNASIVSADSPLERVVDDVLAAIIEKRACMTRNMLNVAPLAADYLWDEPSTCGYTALPSKNECRWIMPRRKKFARLSWQLYAPCGRLGRCYKAAMLILWNAGIVRIFPTIKTKVARIGENAALKTVLESFFGQENIVLACSQGTIGYFRKTTYAAMSKNAEMLCYVKVGNSQQSNMRVRHEADMLRQLKMAGDRSQWSFIFPKCVYEGIVDEHYFIMQMPCPFDGDGGPRNFCSLYEEVVYDLTRSTMSRMKYLESEYYKTVENRIQNSLPLYRVLLRHCISKMEDEFGDDEFLFSFSHGDFSPWNTRRSDKGMYIFDWESALPNAIFGVDIVHFMFQTGMLLNGFRGRKLLDNVFEPSGEILTRLSKRFFHDAPSIYAVVLSYLIQKSLDEDQYDPLNKSAIERRRIISLLLEDGSR